MMIDVGVLALKEIKILSRVCVPAHALSHTPSPLI